MRALSLLALAALYATPVLAQPLHGNPQKSAYASPAEWPELFDGQMHWSLFDGIQTQHCVHLIPKVPYGAELDDTPFDVPFTMKMFHCAASVTALIIADYNASPDVTWDMGVKFPVKGDKNALLSFTGKVRIDPKRLGRFHHKHGWTQVRMQPTMAFENGDVALHNFLWSYFSVADPTAPEEIPPGGFGPVISVRNTIQPKSGTNFGDMVMEVDDWLPLLPIVNPWMFRIAAYNYTAVAPCCPDGLFEQRRDLDLHAGNPGILITSNKATQQGVERTIILDPAGLAKGPHKDGLFWKSTFGPETIAALLAFSWSVGDGVPPPPLLCTDPMAPNFGGPAPCLPPIVTPPTETWATIAPGFQRKAINGVPQNVFRFCLGSECFTFPVTPVQQ